MCIIGRFLVLIAVVVLILALATFVFTPPLPAAPAPMPRRGSSSKNNIAGEYEMKWNGYLYTCTLSSNGSQNHHCEGDSKRWSGWWTFDGVTLRASETDWLTGTVYLWEVRLEPHEEGWVGGLACRWPQGSSKPTDGRHDRVLLRRKR